MSFSGDDINPHELNGPSPDEILAIWAQVIRDLKASRVCFYAGPQGVTPDFEDFLGALPMIGDCDALIYAEPRLTKHEVWAQVKRLKDKLPIHVPGGGLITAIEMVNTGGLPGVDRQGLFGQPGAEAMKPGAQPPDDRFWGLYSRLTIAGRLVHLLHIGIGGDAARTYFFQPHGIQPRGIQVDTFIGDPPYQ